MSEEEFQLKEQPFVEFTVRAYQAWNEKEGRGISVFKIFPTDVSNDDGERLGSIAGGTGHLTISVNDGEHAYQGEYLVPHDDIWHALQAALAPRSDGMTEEIVREEPFDAIGEEVGKEVHDEND